MSRVRTAINAIIADPRKYIGRPMKMTNEDLDLLIDFITTSRRNRRMTWDNVVVNALEGKHGRYAIRYALRKLGFHRCPARRKPPISETNRLLRLL